MRPAAPLAVVLASIALSAPAGAVTIPFELDLLEGAYTFVPEEKGQTVVVSERQAFRALSLTLGLETGSACSAACDPPSSFLFGIGPGVFVNIGPFEGSLDLTLPLPFFRPLFLFAGQGFPFTLSLGRFPEGNPFPTREPSAPATVTQARILFHGDLLTVPEPGVAALFLVGLAVVRGACRRHGPGSGSPAAAASRASIGSAR